MTEQRKGLHWLTTVPGILTGVAALITAVVGLIGALQLLGMFDSDDSPHSAEGWQATPAPGPTDGTSEGQPSSPTDEATPVEGTGGQVAADGRLTIEGEAYNTVDLETGVVGSGIDLMIRIDQDYISVSQLSQGYFSAVAADADLDQCQDALTADRVDHLEVKTQDVGTRWCVVVRDRIAWIEVVEVAYPAPRRFVFDYVLWDV